MESFLKGAPGIFTPDQVRRMQERFQAEAPAGESAQERKLRALRILREEELSLGLRSN